MDQHRINSIGVDSSATQIRTTIASKLAPFIVENERANGLEYGAGLCHGAELLGLESFEPYPKDHVKPTYTKISHIKKHYDFILCTYVLNVVGEDTRVKILKDIKRLLKKKGRAFIVVRGEADFKGGAKDHIMYKGKTKTYQHGFSFNELAKLCESVGFKVSKLKGSSAKSIRVSIRA